MKTAKTFPVILVTTALILSTPFVTQAKTRTFVIVTVGGGVVVGGTFIIWRIALFFEKAGPPRDNNTPKEAYVDSEEEKEKLSARPAVHGPLLTLRF
jgi:hypothetical protein